MHQAKIIRARDKEQRPGLAPKRLEEFHLEQKIHQ
jgi:hypothetical protein